MASSTLNEKANGSRLSRLLVDKGTQALRQVFDTHLNICSATLPGLLSINKPKLKALRYKHNVINRSQWNLLYPASGPPDSKNFDVTLLTILLRNICGLASPAAGWGTMPHDSDTSIEAYILKIKMFRNEVLAHTTTTEIDNNTFESLWKKISEALVALGIPNSEIDELKEAPLGPEEDAYIQLLKEWKKEEDELIAISGDTNVTVKVMQKEQAEMKAMIEKLQQEAKLKLNVSDVDKLTKCDFTGNIRKLSASFQEGTRTWLLDRLDSWFTNSDSQVMILTAGPGIGKSVFAAKVCNIYQKSGKLAACHFCKFNNSDYRDPRTLLQSLASHMCDNVEGFKDKLVEQLRRSHRKETLSDAFRVLLNDPLYALEERDPMLIVIDAIDESEIEGKSELLELISDEFGNLPEWIKILITTRPELPVQEKLSHLNPFEIRSDNRDNEDDLFRYFNFCLSDTGASEDVLLSLVNQCQGSFLYAYYVQLELRGIKELTKDKLQNFAAKGIAGFYEKQFKRLKDYLSPLKLEVKRLVNVLVASKGPLPLVLLRECLGLSKEADFELRKAVDDTLSSFLPVYDDSLTAYHKSLIDWLKSDGYGEHLFTADVKDGDRHLWCACEKFLINLTRVENRLDLKLSPALKYAVKHGTFHLLRVRDWSKSHWLVDVKLNHIMACVSMRDPCMYLFNGYIEVAYHPEVLNYLRCKIWLQDRLNNGRSWNTECGGYYLQCVANGWTAVNVEDNDKNTAISLLKSESYVWCEDLNVIKHHSNCLRMSWVPVDAQCIGISPNKLFVAAGDMHNGTIVILQLPNLDVLFKYESEMTCGVPCCTFSPDSSTLLYGSLDYCLNVNERKKVPFFPGHSDQFVSCCFSPSGNRLLTSNGTRFVKLWDVSHEIQLTCLDAGVPVDHCFFSKCGLLIVAKNKYGITGQLVLTIWNALTWLRIDRRHFSLHDFNPASPISGFEWIEASTQSDKNSEPVVLPIYQHCFIVIQLPYGYPFCWLRGGFWDFVTRYKKQYCMLIYEEQRNSFMIVDPAKRSVIAHRRVQSSTRPIICPIVMVDEFIIVSNFRHFLSFKAPNALPFLPLLRDVTLTCCSFSPHALFFATCDDQRIVRIWCVESCSVTQICTFPRPAMACWWSESSLWFVFGSHIAKVHVNGEKEVKFSEVKNVHFKSDCLNLQTLSFSSSVLIMRYNDSIHVFQIIDDNLQPETILPTSHSFDSASVGPDGCNILLASGTKYQVWRKRESDDQAWYLDHNVKINPTADYMCEISWTKCRITSDGAFGAILFGVLVKWHDQPYSFCYVSVADLATSKLVWRFSFRDHSLYSSFLPTFYAGSSLLVFHDESRVFIWTLHDRKIAAVWTKQDSPKDTMKSVLGFHSGHKLIAIPQSDGYINFVEIHGL